LSRFEYDIFLVANSKEQVQTYINEIDIKKITAFIIDDYDIVLNKKLRSPMIGLYSTFKELNNLEYIKVFVIACDNPFIKYDVISYLIDESKAYDCCIPKWDNGFLEPLLAIYPIKKAYRTSKESVKKSNYKLTHILRKKWEINYISIENSIQVLDKQLITFKNINKSSDIEDLNAFKM